jgi:hypothetical protein
MNDVQPTARSRSTTATVSLAAAAVFAVFVFASGLAMNGGASAVAGVCFACWVALPLTLLGTVKLFRGFPMTHLVLLVLGLLVSASAAASPYGHSSTSAIGLLTVPFFLLLLYALAGFVLVCVKTYRQ